MKETFIAVFAIFWKDILSGLGIPLRVSPADVDETPSPAESPAQYLDRVVESKLARVAELVAPDASYAGVLVADTVVVVDDRILGKPGSLAEARGLLGLLVGRTHRVDTRYAISRAACPSRAAAVRSVQTFVTMRCATGAEIARYAATGEGRDKAGAYAAQGIGAFLIERIEGSYTNVVGLPACEVIADLGQLGLLEHYP